MHPYRRKKNHTADGGEGGSGDEGRLFLVTMNTFYRTPLFEDERLAERFLAATDAQVEQGQVVTRALVVMPDHVQWLLELVGAELNDVVQAVKDETAAGSEHDVWQDGFKKRLIPQERANFTAKDIIEEPVRVGLVDDLEQYRFWRSNV